MICKCGSVSQTRFQFPASRKQASRSGDSQKTAPFWLGSRLCSRESVAFRRTEVAATSVLVMVAMATAWARLGCQVVSRDVKHGSGL